MIQGTHLIKSNDRQPSALRSQAQDETNLELLLDARPTFKAGDGKRLHLEVSAYANEHSQEVPSSVEGKEVTRISSRHVRLPCHHLKVFLRRRRHEMIGYEEAREECELETWVGR